MVILGGTLQRPLEAPSRNFDTVLQELIQLVEPQKTNTYTVPPNPAVSKPGGPIFLVLNPVRDGEAAVSTVRLTRSF